ncbi:MAG: hypothetical protein ABH878_10005, partial [bacterium]
DVIVGFPGETDRDFKLTVELLEDIPFNHLHVFPFSERAGTKAAQFSEAIPIAERFRRARFLRELDRRARREFIAQNLQQYHDVVVIQRRKSKYVEGLTSNYLRVQFTEPIAPVELNNRVFVDGVRIILSNQQI